MEGTFAEFQEKKVLEMNSTIEDFLLAENSNNGDQEDIMPKKSAEELAKEEERLIFNLDKLKKDNFTLQISINAWQNILKNKLDEFKEAGLKLDKIYSEIWSERDKFCSEADKFNLEYGIFSEWWKAQLNFLSELEDLGKKKSDQQKSKEEIEKLEKEIEEIKKEIDDLQTGTQVAEVEVHSPEESNCKRGEDTTKEVLQEGLVKKKIKMQEEDDQIKSYEEEEEKPTGNDLYSMVDVEKVRKANRKRNRRKDFLGRVKTLLTH